MPEKCKLCDFFGSPDYDGYCSSCFRRKDPIKGNAKLDEKRALENLWQTANNIEDDGTAVQQIASLFARVDESWWHTAFKMYCLTGRAERIRLALQNEILRPSILRIRNLLLNTIRGADWGSGVPERLAVLEVLLTDAAFRREADEDILKAAVRTHEPAAVRLLLRLAEEGVFDVTLTAVDEAQDFRPLVPGRRFVPAVPNLRQLEILELVRTAHAACVARLNALGRFQNLVERVAPGQPSLRAFPTPFHRPGYGEGSYPSLLAERDFSALSATVRLKPDWRRKLRDPEIVARWRAEFVGPAVPALSTGVRAHVFELAMEQLQMLARIGEDEGFEASAVHGVYQSDTLVAPEEAAAFCALARRLERAVPRDEHPGSDGRVVDFVHPSLFPVVAGSTPLRPRAALTLTQSVLSGLGDLGLPPVQQLGTRAEQSSWCHSERYQWLPAEFAVSASGDVSINSYINNLHPGAHGAIYPAIARVFAAGLPMLEQVLSDTLVTDTQKQSWRLIRDAGAQEMYAPRSDEDEDEDDSEDEREVLPLVLPDHYPVAETERSYTPRTVSLRDSRLQVIVKLASTEFSPEQPEFPGGSWHCEGMQNEHIVATLIYYYDVENVGESRLRFRQAICEPDYAQDDARGVRHRYGLEDEAPLCEELGHILTQGGRLVAFPNIFQHAVAGMRTEDASKPGHRKILVFFLVDPLHRVISSADVPPQQRAWVCGRVPGLGACSAPGCGASRPVELLARASVLHRLLYWLRVPAELVEAILEYLPFPFSQTDAERHRLALMEQRTNYQDAVTEEVFARPFSLCEH